jgi:hypothetical protein
MRSSRVLRALRTLVSGFYRLGHVEGMLPAMGVTQSLECVAGGRVGFEELGQLDGDLDLTLGFVPLHSHPDDRDETAQARSKGAHASKRRFLPCVSNMTSASANSPVPTTSRTVPNPHLS